MSSRVDILDEEESLTRPFAGALGLHVGVVLAIMLGAWLGRASESFGAKDVGGAVGIEAVDKIPIPHSGPVNPVANDTQSQVPQQPAPPVAREREEKKSSPNAVPLKMPEPKKKTAPTPSTPQRFRPFDELEKNQIYSKSPPQVSSPMYSPAAGSGQIGTGIHTTLGDRFAAYSDSIRRIVAQNWRTGDVDPQLHSAPAVIATFNLLRDGSVANLQLLQSSGIPSLDASVQRAIRDSSHGSGSALTFPPLPDAYGKDSATVEFQFELKR